MVSGASILGAAGISALGNIVGGIASNELSAFQMRELAKYQASLNYKYAKKSALEMPGFNRQGLETAGYNPMLALGNLGNAVNSWVGTSNPTTPDLSRIGSNAVDTAMNIAQTKSNVGLQNSQATLNNATESKVNAETFNIMSDTVLKDIQKDNINLQNKLLNKDINWYDKKQYREDLRLNNDIQRSVNDYKLGILGASAQNAIAGAQQTMAGANAEEQRLRAEWIRKHPHLYMIERMTPSAALGVGAGAGIFGAMNGFKGKKPVGFR